MFHVHKVISLPLSLVGPHQTITQLIASYCTEPVTWDVTLPIHWVAAVSAGKKLKRL